MAGSQQGWRSGVGGGGSAGVQSVTGLDTDNTDPTNPIVNISVDGATITGDGTPLNPLVSVASGNGHIIQEEGISFPQRANLNFKGFGVIVTDDAINNATDVSIDGAGYGSWYDTTTQTALHNAPTPMEFNTPDFNTGVSIVNDTFGNPTEITVVNAGIYNVQFSVQTYRTGGGTVENLNIWLRINGLDVPFSNTQITFKNNTEYQVQAWNFFVPLLAGENCQIMWAITDIRIQLPTIPASLVPPIVPETPSVILTVTRL